MIKTLAQFYYHQSDNKPKKDAFTQKENGQWVSLSSQEFVDKANQLSTGLLKLGIKRGDKIAVISNNRTEWHLLDLAVQQLGIVNVPLYPNITEEDYKYILNDSGAKMVFISDEAILARILNIKEDIPLLEHIYTFNIIEDQKHYSGLLNNEVNLDEIKQLSSVVEETDVATLIYTSGTTGNPKGVMLTHRNLVSNVLEAEERLPIKDDQRGLSFLPLCHVFERMLDYLYIYKSVSVYYAESMDSIGEDLKDVKPHIFATVPRLLEKVYDKIVAKGNDLSGVKKILFFWALRLGLKYDPIESGGIFYTYKLKISNKIIFNKWREALGGNVMVVGVGGAALQPRLARVFTAAKIPVLEGYGLTETSPVIAVNSCLPEGMMIGTVGLPLKNLEVKIASDGEILVKGPSVMKGYYNQPELTKEVINADGYFHTGDIGELVGGKYLKITDRKKEIFKTSGGKYIAPQVMENKFKESRFIEQVMVVGEGEKMPAAFIQPNFLFLEGWCDRKNIPFVSAEEIVKVERVIARFQKEVNVLNERFSSFEQIKRFELINHVWTIDSGELTPTLKLKRKNILEKNKALYQKIYEC
ncbi:MAG: long-chain fatty acid--CoA ligase [Flavobacteriales bacterium]